MQLLKTLIDQKPGHGKQALTAPLHELYDGDMQFPVCRGPYTIANFVGTLDGVISFKKPGFAGGSAISGSNTADRFTMGLLRATADAIVVGAHTVHDVDPHSLWTAEYARLRILRWPDAFPATDLGIQKALGKDGKKVSETEALARAAAWRPWRSYATMLLWKSLVNHGG